MSKKLSDTEKKVPVGIRLDPDVRAFFEEIAEVEGRTLSSVLARTLEHMAFNSPNQWRKQVLLSMQHGKPEEG